MLPAGHPLAAQATLTPADLQGENYISLSRTDSYRQLLDALFLEHQVKRRMVVETHSAASICAMVRAGAGISVVNPLTARTMPIAAWWCAASASRCRLPSA